MNTEIEPALKPLSTKPILLWPIILRHMSENQRQKFFVQSIKDELVTAGFSVGDGPPQCQAHLNVNGRLLDVVFVELDRNGHYYADFVCAGGIPNPRTYREATGRQCEYVLFICWHPVMNSLTYQSYFSGQLPHPLIFGAFNGDADASLRWVRFLLSGHVDDGPG